MRASQHLHAAAIALLLMTGPALAQEAPPARGTLVSAEAGDIACHLRIRDEAGRSRAWMAEFEMCEQAPRLIGRNLAFTWKAGRVQHPSCQGDPDCRRSLQVMLVTGMQPR
jgi:hypothetical protein